MSLADKLQAFRAKEKTSTPLRMKPTKPTKPNYVGFVGGSLRGGHTFSSNSEPHIDQSPPPPPETDNPYIDQVTWATWAHSFGNSEDSVRKALELEARALNMGFSWRRAWQIAEAVALYVHHIKDGRRSCLECRNYRHRTGTQDGRCMAAGYPPNVHMNHGGSVPAVQMSRCKAFTGMNQ